MPRIPMLVGLGKRVGGGGRKKGRIKLTSGQPTGQTASASRGHVKMK